MLCFAAFAVLAIWDRLKTLVQLLSKLPAHSLLAEAEALGQHCPMQKSYLKQEQSYSLVTLGDKMLET